MDGMGLGGLHEPLDGGLHRRYSPRELLPELVEDGGDDKVRRDDLHDDPLIDIAREGLDL
jgi:hypothetical protein